MSNTNLLIDPLPTGWENHQFADVCDRVKDSYKPVAGGDTPYVGLEHLTQGFPAFVGRGTESDIKSSKTAFKVGDILFGKLRSYLRKGAQADFDGISSTDILVFRAEKLCDAGFLKYLIHSDEFIDHAKSTTSGVQHPRTSWSALKEFRLSLPPIPEQKKIAHILSTVQRAIEAQEQIIQTTTELFKTMLHQLMTAQISVSKESQITQNSKRNRGANTELQETEIGKFPSAWENHQLADVCERVKDSYKPVAGGKTPYVGLEHLAQGFPAFVGRGTESDVKSSKTAFKAGDILFGKLRSYLRKGAQADFDGISSTDILVFRAEGLCEAGFLKYLIHSDEFIDHAKSTTSGVQHPRTSWSSLKEFRFSLPLLPEQKKIAKILSTIQQKADNAQIRKTKLQALFRTLLHELMTAKIRVNEIDK